MRDARQFDSAIRINLRAPSVELDVLPARVRKLLTSGLPDEADSQLLRATLLSGDAAGDAWQAWTRLVGDPVRVLGTDRRYLKILIPLLGRNLAANDIDCGRDFITLWRVACLVATRRLTVYRRETAQVLCALTEAGLDPIVLKGAAYADTVYPDPALRHAGDLDLLLNEAQLNAAVDVLNALDFARRRPDEPSRHHLPGLVSVTGLHVELHRELSPLYEHLDAGRLDAGAIRAVVAGVRTRVLGSADALVHTCVHAAGCTTSASLRWVCDAWLLADGLELDDWNAVAQLALDANAAIPVAVALGYLERTLSLPVPDEVSDTLEAAVTTADSAAVSAAIVGARSLLPFDLSGVLSMRGDWRERLTQIAWRLLPPRRHVRLIHGAEGGWQIATCYLRRLGRLPRNVRGIVRLGR